MFEGVHRRPIVENQCRSSVRAYNLFVYAYEDVTACNKLFWSQRRLLEERNLFELACALTDKRCPPLSLPPSAKLHEQPARIAIALTDTLSVVCLRNKETGIISLPSAEYIPNVIVKSQGRREARP